MANSNQYLPPVASGGPDVFLTASAVNTGTGQIDLTLNNAAVVSQNIDEVLEWGTNAHITYGLAV